MAADAQRFLVTVPAGQAAPASITLELDWPAGLKKR